MKVKELIVELQKQDPELDVLTGDFDDWWYRTYKVRKAYIKEGREVYEDSKSAGQLCVVVEVF